MSKNLTSATEHHDQLIDKVKKEVSLGRIMGPFKQLPLANLHISPIGLVPKADGGWRMITHLSYPKSKGVNHFIDSSACTVHYSSFDNVIDMISRLGKGALLGKLDIKSAFRLVPVYPGDFDLLGFCIDGLFFFDKCLPMGCSISCKIWETFATFLHWLTETKAGLSTLDHYLDDFIFAGEKNSEDCKKLMDRFRSLCYEIDIPLADDKTIGPVTTLTFLGIEINTMEMLMKIPQDKIEELLNIIQSFLNRKKLLKRELESLVGMLNFFGKAVRFSRAFSRRFYDAMSSVPEPHHHIRISSELREDLNMWHTFLRKFNGISYFPASEWVTSSVLQLYTDSAGSVGLGCGAYLHGKWVFYEWPIHWRESDYLRDLTFLELIPVLRAVCLWGNELANKKVVFNIDNLALVSVVNKQTSKSKRVMRLVRPFVLKLMEFNCIFKACHKLYC